MVESAAIALVSPGKSGGSPRYLNNKGWEQAAAAGDMLLKEGHFLGAVVLSPPNGPARQTADCVQMKVDDGMNTYLIAHVALEVGGKHPEYVESVRRLGQDVIAHATPWPAEEYTDPLVIVTHPPLIAAVMGIEVAAVADGSVHLCVDDGHNPGYRPRPEADLQHILGLSSVCA